MLRIIGLDLSFAATAMVCLDEQGNVIDHGQAGYSLPREATQVDKIMRLLEIAKAVLAFLEKQQDNKTHKSMVAIENYAFTQAKAKPGQKAPPTQIDIGEVHGVVKTQLWLKYQIVPEMVAIQGARRRVLGVAKLPGKDPAARKKELLKLVEQVSGVKFPSHDQADAWVTAEYARRAKLCPQELLS